MKRNVLVSPSHFCLLVQALFAGSFYNYYQTLTKAERKKTRTHRVIRELFISMREKSFIQRNVISGWLCFWPAWPAQMAYIYLEESSHCTSQEMTMERNKECSSFSFPLIYLYFLLKFLMTSFNIIYSENSVKPYSHGCHNTKECSSEWANSSALF